MHAQGVVNHLGRSTLHLQSQADISGVLPTPIPPTTGVVTAANGDEITFVLRWTAQPAGSGAFHMVGPYEITGGTGRFAGARGGGTYSGLVDLNAETVAADIEGSVLR